MTSADVSRLPVTASAAALAAFVLFVAGCGDGTGRLDAATTGETMGTHYRVRVYAPEAGNIDTANWEQAVRDALDDVNARMSTYRDESELSRFNAHETPEPFPLSSRTRAVFQAALEVYEETGGAFDVTVGPLVDAWGFGPKTVIGPPGADTVSALRERVGSHMLELTDAGLAKARPDIRCDLSGIAKGYASDYVAEVLEARGFTNYMVEVGGDLRVRGVNPDGVPWRIGIEKPTAGQRAIQRAVPLRDTAMATTGDYRNFYESGGKRFSHTIDPRTGRPVAHALASVTVLHPQCARADAYATALMVKGPETGMAFADAHDLPALFIVHGDDGAFEERESAAWRARFPGGE